KRRARTRLEVVVPCELEDAIVKPHVLAGSLEHDALEVVVEDDTRHAAEVLERLGVSAQEALHRLIEREPREHRAAEREHHHEARETTLRALDLDESEVAPVDLRLLAGHRIGAE